MSNLNFAVAVHCNRPPWARLNPKYADSRYRIYVNSELLIERNWLWDNSTYINEHIQVELINTKTYNLKLEPVTILPEQATFSLGKIQISNFEFNIDKLNDTEINFSIR